MSWRIMLGDVRERLAELPDQSVQCCVTSPPYWGLRDYGTATWEGGVDGCDHLKQPVRAIGDRKSSTLVGTTETIRAAEQAVAAYRDICGKCGARRIDNQIGLEATPDAYVAQMVQVFAQVRRVLKDDGTLWLNLGDSYATGAGSVGNSPGGGAQGEAWKERGQMTSPNRMPIVGLKPKDLCGIPWRVAFALQQPYEHHIIKSATDRAWMAGLVDGEGCVSVVAVPPTTGVNESHSMRLQIRMADVEAVDRVVAITGMSNVTHDLDTGPNSRPAQQWKISGDKAALLADIYPFLTVKRRQAIVGWNIQRLKDGIVTRRGQPIPHENIEQRRLLHSVLRQLNQREEPADIPSWCVEPEFQVDPGWYLRSDVIWSKPNPMPESVTDRPTKAHEYIFLLTKSSRYFYDAEAIAEPADTAGESRVTVDHGGGGYQAAAMNRRPSGNQVPGTLVIRAETRNCRTVWDIATQPYPDAHFATFPEAIPERCIKAGSKVGDTVLDPFCGAGTTGLVADRLERDFIGIELNPVYRELARKRIGEVTPLFPSEQSA